jgi:hypothetical protein
MSKKPKTEQTPEQKLDRIRSYLQNEISWRKEILDAPDPNFYAMELAAWQMQFETLTAVLEQINEENK